jgi:hypothetical protein
VSREFYEKVKFVLDRSRLNRIISHNPKSRVAGLVLNSAVEPDGAFDLLAIIFTPAHAPPVRIVILDDLSLHSHPFCPNLPDTLCPARSA